MDAEDIKSWSEEIVRAISHAHMAHSVHPVAPDDTVRFHDRSTPYLVHPIWCAATLLQEQNLPLEIRKTGFIALLWHDTLEDTTLPLPSNTSDVVAQLVHHMTFENFEEERSKLWECSTEVRLLKLYDKVSNLLDGNWMKAAKWNIYVDHTLKLATDVEQNFGVLNIVKIARAIAEHK